jgi:hypothetical protein
VTGSGISSLKLKAKTMTLPKAEVMMLLTLVAFAVAFVSLQHTFNQGFNRLDARFDRLDGKLDTIEHILRKHLADQDKAWEALNAHYTKNFPTQKSPK